MIVIGHEITHLLVLAVERQTGVNWSEVYEQRVERNWSPLAVDAAEEEAAIIFSLRTLKMGYYFSLNGDTRENRTEIIYEMHTWSVDFLNAVKALEEN